MEVRYNDTDWLIYKLAFTFCFYGCKFGVSAGRTEEFRGSYLTKLRHLRCAGFIIQVESKSILSLQYNWMQTMQM